jgi:hypothetical protein
MDFPIAKRYVVFLGIWLVSALGLTFEVGWSQELTESGDSRPKLSADFQNLEFIFSLIEKDRTSDDSDLSSGKNQTQLAKLAKAHELKAKAGDREAQFKFGALCLEGLGVRANYGQAVRWFSAAGGRDHPLAQLAEGKFRLKSHDAMHERRLRERTIEAIGKIGPSAERAIPILEQELGRDWPFGSAAAVALGRMGQQGVSILSDALASKDVGIRRAAAEGLSEAGEAARPAIAKLTAALEDEDLMTRQHADRALKRLRAKEEAK